MSTQTGYFEREQIAAKVPIWREAFAGLDWLALRSSPVFYGLGVPRGDGSPVILVPGFLADDLYLTEMYNWLQRIGYRPYMSKVGRMADCFDILVDRLRQTIERVYLESGRQVHLVGHSMGGMISRSAAQQKPHQVASIITLGSPFRGIASHPWVLGAGKLVQNRIHLNQKRPDQPYCFTGKCTCKAINALEESMKQRQIMYTAIYTKKDGIVDWRYCINDDPSTNFEVHGTHVGLAFNPFVYHLVAKRLHQAVQKVKAEGPARPQPVREKLVWLDRDERAKKAV